MEVGGERGKGRVRGDLWKGGGQLETLLNPRTGWFGPTLDLAVDLKFDPDEGGTAGVARY